MSDPLILSQSDIDYLLRVVARLDNTSVLDPETARRISEQFTREVVGRMLTEGGTFGQMSGGPSILNQSYEDFLAEKKSIDNDLGRQVEITDEMLDKWFDHGQVVYPAWPWRIAVILRKAKRKDLERRFLAAFTRHFHSVGYERFVERAQKADVYVDVSAGQTRLADNRKTGL